MRALTLLLLLGFLVVPILSGDAEAQSGLYSFSWYSEVFGRNGMGENFRNDIAGRGTARISLTASFIVIDFDTPLGPAHIEVPRDSEGFTYENRLPFELPADFGGRRIYDLGALPGSYSGGPTPETFTVRASAPGSGPSPQYIFYGTGTREVLTSWITQPVDGAPLSGNVQIGMGSMGGVGTTRTFTVYVDNQPVSTQTVNDDEASYTLNTAGLSGGNHTISVGVSDGSTSDVMSRTVTVASAPTAPAGVTFNLTNDQTVRGSVAVQITANGLGADTKRFNISVAPSDGQAAISPWVVRPNTITWWWNTRNYANGTHTLSLRVVNPTGAAATGSVRVIISN
jgi:hypothetical protein